MAELIHQNGLYPIYMPLAELKDMIGWYWFLEGMVLHRLTKVVEWVGLRPGYLLTISKWMGTLITKLLEVTCGIWIYRNITIHDNVSSLVATKGKEQLLKEIE